MYEQRRPQRGRAVVCVPANATIGERVWFGDGPAAPSFLDIATEDDQLVVVHSFSKSFLMTGWRLGWVVLPPALVPAVEKLAQNLYICPSTLAQHAALACFEPASLA